MEELDRVTEELNRVSHSFIVVVVVVVVVFSCNLRCLCCDRYKRNKDWRTAPSSSSFSDQQQQQSKRRQRLFASSLLLSKQNLRGNGSKTVAPDARFLRLLEANRGCSQLYNDKNKNTGGVDSRNGTAPKLLLQQRSSHGSNNNINVFRSPPKESNVPTVPMTLADGSRVYVRCSASKTNRTAGSHSAAGAADETNNHNDNNRLEQQQQQQPSAKSCALGVSMKELFRRVDAMRRRSIASARRPFDPSATTAVTGNKNTHASNNRDDRLWVDKHAPRSFPHLLSDERTNREVLRALRGWDPYVFRKAPPLRPLYQRQREQELKEQQTNAKGDNSKTNSADKKHETEKKPDGGGSRSLDKRPEENARVILLSGPPGVGT
jgi:hypothetical protein